MGAEVEVRLYRAMDGHKDYVGVLAGYEDGAVTLSTSDGEKRFSKKDVAQVRLYVTF